MAKLSFILVLFGSITHCGFSLFIDGCPMSGCRPSGSFSMYLQVARENASIKWLTDFLFDPAPTPLGCVADSVNIVCPSNGPFSEDKGYVSLSTENGTIKWRDRKLNYPTLPLLDNNGDVTGSDGKKLVYYDANGKSYPTIPCADLLPIFNMAIVGDTFLLLVSHNGMIVVRQTNGVPVGYLTLNATLGGVNGTYLPIAQPVINKQRFYLLTKFSPLNSRVRNTESTQNKRLYAIDVHRSISNRITVAWFINVPHKPTHLDNSTYNKTKYDMKEMTKQHSAPSVSSDSGSSLIWNRYNNTIYIMTSSSESDSNTILYGVTDNGDVGKLVFQSNLDAQSMAMFVSDHCERGHETKERISDSILWVLTKDSKIHQVSKQGVSVRVIDLNILFNMSVTVTTKVSLTRNSDMDADILIFGVVLSSTNKKETISLSSYIVAVDTNTEKILWTVPIPDSMIARGQISGVSGADMREKDQLIVYTEIKGKSAKIISII